MTETPPHLADPVYQREVYAWLKNRMLWHAGVGAALGFAFQVLRGVF